MSQQKTTAEPTRRKANPKARALLIHGAAYLAVVVLLAGLNLWRNPTHPWFLWVAAGWGIGLGAHGLGFWLAHGHRKGRVFRDSAARGFVLHAFVYLGVIALLVAVNIAAGKHHYWALWVAAGWGLGLLIHGWIVLFAKRGKAAPDPARDHEASPHEARAHEPR